jgi:hypothetical protein
LATVGFSNIVGGTLELKNNKYNTYPEGAKAIGSKWVYAIKPGMNDKTIRYKARLVAKGYNQWPGERN